MSSKEIIISIGILLISILINSLSYYYLLDKHKSDSKKSNDYNKIKSITMYGVSSLVFIVFIICAYLINYFALELSLTKTWMIIGLVIISYLVAIIVSFVHSNMTVEYVKYLIREETSEKRILVLIIHNILILGVTYISLQAFIPLVDSSITSILRIVLLVSFILSFTLVIIYKELKSKYKKK